MAETRRPDERGFALLVVLWIFIVLFVLGAEFATSMRQDAQATVNFADETQSYYLATAAANRTFYRALIARDEATLGLTSGEVDNEDFTPAVHTDGRWHREELWGAPVWVRVTDEAGKIPINLVEFSMLVHLLGNMGLDPEAAGEVADSILDWRDPDDDHRMNGVESEYYLGLAQPYSAKNAPLDSLDELRLIKGVSEDLYYGGTEDYPIGLVQVFSVFNRRAALSIRSASPEVFEVLLGLTPEELQMVMEQRQTDMAGLIGMLQSLLPDPALEDLLDDDAPSILSVEAQARLPDARIGAHIGAVIDLGESNEGIYILRWMDALPMDSSVGAGSAGQMREAA
ncbi:MAG: hypothetical protein VCC00_01250 [Deltaproteobacteria bacterium]